MKLKNYLWVAFTAALFAGCDNDHSDLWNEINSQGERIEALETWQKQVNNDISALQQLLNTTDYITDVTPVMLNGEQVGYTIRFLNSDPITIYNGEKGDKGDKGDRGDKGEMPQISAKQQPDGNWYWTLNGELLKDQAGNYIRANGEKGEQGDKGEQGLPGAQGPQGEQGEQGPQGEAGTPAPAPQLLIGSSLPTDATIKTDNGANTATAWYLSVDNGATWYRVSGKDGVDGTDGSDGAPGRPGTNGESLFSKVETKTDAGYVEFTLKSGGSSFQVPLYKGIGITLSQGSTSSNIDLTGTVDLLTNNVLNYAFTGSSSPEPLVSAFISDNKEWSVTVNRGAKTITINPATIEIANLVIIVTDNQANSRSYTLAVKRSNFYGAGTSADDPYRISNAQELRYLATQVSIYNSHTNVGSNYSGKYFQLTNDIDLEDKEWTPIGTNVKSFAGSFSGKKADGGNYEIKRMKITDGSLNRCGLFGSINTSSGVTLSNITVSGSITVQPSNGVCAGGIVGDFNKSTIENCVSNCNIEVTQGTGSVMVGGIAGRAQNSTATIEKCRNTGNITLKANTVTSSTKGISDPTIAAGGIIGQVSNNTSTMTECTNTGEITNGITSSDKGIGSIIGYVNGEKTDMTRCTNTSTGKVTDGEGGGAQGIIGYVTLDGAGDYVTLTGCNNEAETNGAPGSIIKGYKLTRDTSLNPQPKITIQKDSNGNEKTELELGSTDNEKTGTYPAESSGGGSNPA